jgi:anti-anti-sigma regulatory factor
MLKITRATNGEAVFTLSGRIEEEDVAGLETLIRSESSGRRIVLDMKDVTLVGRDGIGFLERCEADGVTLQNCARYVRELITRQRRGS